MEMVSNDLAHEGGRLMAAQHGDAGIVLVVSCEMNASCKLRGGRS